VRRTGVPAFAACILIIFGSITHFQIHLWHDSWTFWNAVLARAPESSLAHMNCGAMLIEKNDLAGAEVELRKAAKLNPADANALTNLSYVVGHLSDYAEAEQLARQALALETSNGQHAPVHRATAAAAYQNMGFALLKQNRVSDAIE